MDFLEEENRSEMCVGRPFILDESKLTFLLNCRHDHNILPMGKFIERKYLWP